LVDALRLSTLRRLGRDIGKLQFVEDEHGSGNEVHRLSAAIKAMYQSIRLLHRQSKQGSVAR
jgi:hypothetical protein